MDANQTNYNRNSIRLPLYDYSSKGMYFITLCVQGWANIFGEVYGGELKLNLFGKIAKEEWLKTEQIRKNVKLHEFIIMPNHFHAIVEILFSDIKAKNNELNQFKSPSQSIGAIVRGCKRAATKRIKRKIYNKKHVGVPSVLKSIDLSKSIWQRNYYDHIIRN